jgi:hypothetical protein
MGRPYLHRHNGLGVVEGPLEMTLKGFWQTALTTSAWLLAAQVLWWAFGPISPVIEINESKSQAWETTSKPGGSVSRLLEFTVKEDVVLHTYRRLVELDCDRCRVYELESAQKRYSAGAVMRQSRSVQIPEHIHPGRYRMEVEGRWQANPLREGHITIPPFTVTVVAP